VNEKRNRNIEIAISQIHHDMKKVLKRSEINIALDSGACRAV